MFDEQWKNLRARVDYEMTSLLPVFKHNSILELMLIAAEDHRFNHHHGVDTIALVRAFWRTVFKKRREGGSTIAMQLVRVLTGRYEPTLSRKLLEIFLALRLARYVEKNKILELYLSVAYFGTGMHGVGKACEKLGYSKHNLSYTDAASVIARLKYPEPYSSNSKSEILISRRTQYILSRYKKFNLGKGHERF